MNYSETYFELDSEEATHCDDCYHTLSVVCKLKGMSRWLIQRIKAMPFCIMYGILFVDTVDMKIKACNTLNAMFVETADTLVFVALTQHLIQSTMRCDNSTLLCIKWPLALIFNRFSIHKKLWKAVTEGFSTIPSILYILILSIQDKDL